MRESIIALIVTTALGLGVVAATGHMQKLDNLEREITALERQLAQQRRAWEIESLFTASQLLEFFARDLAAAGAVVHVSVGE